MSDLKRCKNGADCVHPDKQADGWLPVSEYYTASSTGNLYSNCKACRRKLGRESRQPGAKNRKTSGELGEDATVYHLKQYGIHSTVGRLSEFVHVDVVAWGCVRIEVKSSRPIHGRLEGWSFNFNSQIGKGVKADLVVLVPLDDDDMPIMFSVFPANFPAFFIRGKYKTRTQLLLNPSHRKSGYIPLTMQDMRDHEDAWDQIEVIRQRISQQLQHGIFNPRRVTKPAERPMPLFDEKAS